MVSTAAGEARASARRCERCEESGKCSSNNSCHSPPELIGKTELMSYVNSRQVFNMFVTSRPVENENTLIKFCVNLSP